MPQENNPDTLVLAERVLPFTPQEIFNAFQQPEQLAQWWGPKGFSNTFQKLEFTAGGHWVYVMHGPNGGNYANESVFQALYPNEKIVIRHISPPLFTLTVTLTPRDSGTDVGWFQNFDNPEVAANVRKLSVNEENLDRLHALLAGKTPS